MYLLELIHLVFAREKGMLGDHFVKNTPSTPYIQFIVVQSFAEETLGRAVPSRGNVLCIRRFAVNAAAGTEIGNLNDAINLPHENILRLDVPIAC